MRPKAWPAGLPAPGIVLAVLALGACGAVSGDGSESTGACVPTTCVDEAKSCGTVADGCGGTLSCGTCSVGTCGGGGVANVCGSPGCAPTTCAAQGKTCGTVADGCGGTVFCGTCSTGTCGAGGVANVCGCTPATCAGLGKTCGTVADGCGGALSCGTCSTGTCGGGGVPNVCGCTPATCAGLAKNCGTVADGCGGTLSCGTCSVGTCGGGGVANVCGSPGCAPTTCAAQGKTCGTVADGCGGTVFCGTCSTGTCGAGGVANVCGCTPATCAGLGKTCGAVADGCGGALSCGTCSTGTCGGGGVPNVCGSPAGTSGCGHAPAQTGYLSRSLTAAGRARQYGLYIPPGTTGTTPLALVVVFHQNGGTIAGAEGFGIQDHSGANAIYLFPQGLQTPYGVGWELGCTGYDFEFFDAMLAATEAEACVDARRVFTTGFSFGADMTIATGCCRGDVVRAIAPTSGMGWGLTACTATRPAFRVTIGTADTIYSLADVHAVTETYRVAHHCTASTIASPPSPPCLAYTGCDAPVVECVYPGMGHSGPPNGWANVWQFFQGF